MKALRRALSGGPRAGALLRRVGANTHARRETSRRSSVARWLAPSGCRVRAPLPVRRLIINACARRASVRTACGSVADSVHTADICFHPMVLLRVAGHRGRCCLCEWHAIPDLARTRSRPTGQQAFRARATTGRPSTDPAAGNTAAHSRACRPSPLDPTSERRACEQWHALRSQEAMAGAAVRTHARARTHAQCSHHTHAHARA